MCSNNRREDFFFFSKTELLGNLNRALYVLEQKWNSLLLYMFLQKERKNQADGSKLVTGLLTFFWHYACDLIVLECVAIVTSQRGTKRTHTLTHERLIHACMYLCVIMHVCMHVCIFSCACHYHLCASLFRLTRGLLGHLCVPFEGSFSRKKSKGLQRTGTKDSLCGVQLIEGLLLSGNVDQNLARTID